MMYVLGVGSWVIAWLKRRADRKMHRLTIEILEDHINDLEGEIDAAQSELPWSANHINVCEVEIRELRREIQARRNLAQL